MGIEVSAQTQLDPATLKAVGKRLAEKHGLVKGPYTETCSMCRFIKALKEGRMP